MRIKARLAAVVVAGVMMLGMGVAPAAAQPVVTGGLVNVTIVDLIDIGDIVISPQVVAQVPIGIAANVCPTVNAAVLASQMRQTGEAACDASADAVANSRAFQNLVMRRGLTG